MSEQPSLADRIQDAIQQHLNDNGGGFQTDFVLVANYIDGDGDSSYFLTCPPSSVVSTTIGLLRWGTLSVEADARRYFDEQLDE